MVPNGNTVTVLTPFTALASLATLVGLCLLGVVVRGTRALTGWWATLPVLLSLSTIPLLAVGALPEPIEERLFEAPTLVLGLGWITLGAGCAQTSHRDQWSEWIVGLKPGTAAWSGVPRGSGMVGACAIPMLSVSAG